MERIKINRNTIITVIVLFTIQAFFFFYYIEYKKSQNEIMGFANNGFSYDEDYRKKQEEYIDGYSSFINNILDKAKSLGQISIFSKEDSFSNNNLKVTYEDFKNSVNIQPVAFNDIFYKQYFSYDMVNAFAVIAGIIVACSLVDNNKKGLCLIIHSSVKGRVALIISKISVLFASSFIISFVFYLGNLILSDIYFNGNIFDTFGYPIQSISEFSHVSYDLDIGMFLGWYVLHKTTMIFSVLLVAWLVLYCIYNRILALFVIGLFGGVTYIFYFYIGSNSPMNYLRYCNIWYLLKDISFFSEYKNLNFFEKAVNKDKIVFNFYLIWISILLITAIIIGAKKYPLQSRKGKYSNKLFNNKIRHLFIKIKEHYSITMFEIDKLYIKQKGAFVIIILFFILFTQIDSTEIQRYRNQELYYDFMNLYEGMPDEKSEEYLSVIEYQIIQIEEEYLKTEALYESGKITKDELLVMMLKYEAFEGERKFLTQIKEQRQYLYDLKDERNIDGWYVNNYIYNNLFAHEDTLGNILLVFSTIIICSGLFAYENKHNTYSILRGTRDGRKQLFTTKLKVSIVSTIVLYVITVVMELIYIKKIYGLSGFAAPVQSIYFLEFVTFECSIGMFVFLLYLVKGMVLVCISILISVMSIFASQKRIIVTVFILFIPTILNAAGLKEFGNYSLVSIMSIGPFLLSTESILLVFVLLVIFLTIGIISYIFGYKKWCTT